MELYLLTRYALGELAPEDDEEDGEWTARCEMPQAFTSKPTINNSTTCFMN